MDMSSYHSSLELQREGARVTGLARNEDDYLIPPQIQSRGSRFTKIVLSISLFAVLGSSFIYRSSSRTNNADIASAQTETKLQSSFKPEVLKVTAWNAYGQQSSLNYPWLSNKVVVEPNRVTTLEVTTTHESLVSESDLTFTWKFQHMQSVDTDEYTVTGSIIEHNFKTLGHYDLSMIASNEKSTITSKQMVHCLYVKREIRSLLSEDREAFLDAAFTIWNVSTLVGRKKYGGTFTGMDKFAREHAAEATGDIMCDHWHEGSGFLTHHLALTLSFDMSLRSIDPSVTLPYWDFTIEGEFINSLPIGEGGGPSEIASVSPVLTAEWFGEVDSLSHVKNSRWAHVDAVYALPNDVTQNSYGIVRAPWNNAKDTELLRHLSGVCGLEPMNKAIPTCTTHLALLTSDSLQNWLLQIAGNGHGPLHVNTGGVFGECENSTKNFYSEYEEDLSRNLTLTGISQTIFEATGIDYRWNDDTEFTMAGLVREKIHLEYYHIYRTLYRSQICAKDGLPNHLSCPESCDEDTPESECLCTCTGIDSSGTVSADFDWENLEPCLYASDTTKDIFKAVVPEDMRKKLITSICSAGVKQGEQLESASPVDPVFWLIHPILDRLTQLKRLAKLGNTPFGTIGYVNAFTDVEWIDYSFYTSTNYTCSGHSMHDAVLPHLPLPQRLINYADSNADGHLSNIEFWEGVDPVSGGGLDYIFDNFDWGHCKNDTAKWYTLGQQHNQFDASEKHKQLDASEASNLATTFANNGLSSGWYSETLEHIENKINPSQSMHQYHLQLSAFQDGTGKMPGINLHVPD